MRGIARDSPEVKPLLSASLPLVMVFAPCQPRFLDIVWVDGPWREWGIYRDFQAASHAWAGWRPMHSYAIWVGPTVRPAWLLSNVAGGAVLIFGGRIVAATAATPMRQLSVRPASLAAMFPNPGGAGVQHSSNATHPARVWYTANDYNRKLS